jgi:hypothetical protein
VNNNPEELLKQLSKSLNLEFFPQDWGIINADPKRVEEFINYYKNNQSLYSNQKFVIQELIIASFNEAMDEGIVSEAMETKFVNFLISNKQDLEFHLKYWSSLEDSEEFPISDFLKKLFSVNLQKSNPDETQ